MSTCPRASPAQEALGFQPSAAAMAAVAEAAVRQAIARSAWREGRRRLLLGLAGARTQTRPFLGADTVAAVRMFQPLAKPAEVGSSSGRALH